jgi:predicted O-linked N-acetylglucosamine transferase (SPINDLY family)
MMPDTIEKLIQSGIEHRLARRLPEAEAIARQILEHQPNHPGALHLLGVAASQFGRTDVAIDFFGRAIDADPSVAEYHNSLGEAQRRSGMLDEAAASLRRAIGLDPELTIAYSNLAATLKRMGHRDEAILAYERGIALRPDDFEGHRNLGVLLTEAGQLDRAIEVLTQAVQLMPTSVAAHINLGFALREAGRFEEAIAAIGRALALEPDHAVAQSNIGEALLSMGRLEEAVEALKTAIRLKPELAEAHNNLGMAFRDQGWLDDALACLRKAVELNPSYANAHSNLGHTLAAAGHLDDAIAEYRNAIKLRPDRSEYYSNLLFTLHYHPDYGPEALLAEHRAWAARIADPLAIEIRAHSNDRDPNRRLRIGFLSPDLCSHPVGGSLLPLFTHRDRRQVEFVCYSDVRRTDALTVKLQGLADNWRDCTGLRDPQLADLIRHERVDILVDTTLHTARNRLLVFARKPAPVQATMLGPPTTTGLATIGYRLTDPYLDPPGTSAGMYSERSIHLPDCFWCYSPPDIALPVSALPALMNGFVTFGCLNQYTKVTRTRHPLAGRVRG